MVVSLQLVYTELPVEYIDAVDWKQAANEDIIVAHRCCGSKQGKRRRRYVT